MKTTLDIPDDLMRAVKIRAVEEDRKLKETVAELLRVGLAHGPTAHGAIRNRVHFPLVECDPVERPEDELTPERVAEILLEEDVERARESLR